jgi:hypothetical protein
VRANLDLVTEPCTYLVIFCWNFFAAFSITSVILSSSLPAFKASSVSLCLLFRYSGSLFEFFYFVNRNVSKQVFRTCVDNCHLVFYCNGEFNPCLRISTFLFLFRLRLSNCVKIRTEFRKLPIHGTVPGLISVYPPLFHRLDLCVTSNTRYRNTYVDRRTNPRVEQVRLQENLSVCNRDYVGWDICRNVTRLSFDDWQCRQDPPPFTIGFKFSGKSFMFLAISSLLITLQARSNKRSEGRKRLQDKPHVPVDDEAKATPHGKLPLVR